MIPLSADPGVCAGGDRAGCARPLPLPTRGQRRARRSQSITLSTIVRPPQSKEETNTTDPVGVLSALLVLMCSLAIAVTATTPRSVLRHPIVVKLTSAIKRVRHCAPDGLFPPSKPSAVALTLLCFSRIRSHSSSLPHLLPRRAQRRPRARRRSQVDHTAKAVLSGALVALVLSSHVVSVCAETGHARAAYAVPSAPTGGKGALLSCRVSLSQSCGIPSHLIIPR